MFAAAALADIDALPHHGIDARPAPSGPRFCLLAAEDQLQAALALQNKRSFTIASSIDAEFLLKKTATGHNEKTRGGKDCQLKYPFFVQGMGIRSMTYFSGPQISLRSDFALINRDRRSGLGRVRDILWIWPPCLCLNRRQALSARETLRWHPMARNALMIVNPYTAAMWQGEGWPVEVA